MTFNIYQLTEFRTVGNNTAPYKITYYLNADKGSKALEKSRYAADLDLVVVTTNDLKDILEHNLLRG